MTKRNIKKNKDKKENIVKYIKLPISKLIDTKFREYALYVLANRGIPSFYDALTPVQRYILMNSPQTFTKTLSVIGDSIKDGYHHGDCLKYDTKINLANGSQIKIGEWAEKYPYKRIMVRSIDEKTLKEVIGIAHSPRIGYTTDEYVKIELENGEIFECTLNHPFFINTKWIEAKDLKKGMIIFSIEGIISKIKYIEKIKSDKPINFYDITVEGYHNFSIGDSNIITHNTSLGKAIAKLARPFGCSMQLLEGYGFFGTEVSPEPASPRYTSIRLSPKASEILNKYRYLFTKEDDGSYSPFWVDFPIGLTTGIIGIAVGYKTTILPRKFEDVKEYLEGKRKIVKPYFKDFTGSIQKYKGLEKSWIISSNIKVIDNKIEVRELPPIMKYTSVLKRLDWLFNRFEGKIRIIDNSSVKVNIDIIYSGNNSEEWKEIQDFVQKTFSIIVSETPIFIKDYKVLVYDRIEDYLDDYKWQLLRLDYKDKEYKRNWISDELQFNRAKKLFISFILKNKRTIKEIDEFLSQYNESIKDRLEKMTSKKFSKDELEKTSEKIKELEESLLLAEKSLKNSKDLFEITPDPTKSRGISSKRRNFDLFDAEDISEIDGVLVWNGDDLFEEPRIEEDLEE